LSAMWKPTQQGQSNPNPTPEPVRPTPVQPSIETPRATTSSSASPAGEQASISKGLSIKGEITGTESLFIDGKIEGSINIPGNRVTVGKNGVVNASISAREIVVLGKLKGNVTATDRVDIRAEGALTGDVAAARISIEDGAFFKGGIDIRKAGQKANGEEAKPTASTQEAVAARA
jgi:cytoskeletal protein CcmA (bactofilin family)